jgi:hypothetical protein
MIYTLMHKNMEVAEIIIDDVTGGINKIINVKSFDHMPVGTVLMTDSSAGQWRRDLLHNWWSERSIPASRDGIKDALNTFGIGSTKLLLEKCYGLSLSDQYWVRPHNTNLSWEHINFFTNN